jgi:hypothetical protein
MRSIYSELILKPSLIVLVSSGLAACSDNAFKSAVFSDPAREAHAKNEKNPGTSDKSSKRSQWEARLKAKDSTDKTDAKKSATPVKVEAETPPASTSQTTVAEVPETESGDFATRRSKARSNSAAKNTPAKNPLSAKKESKDRKDLSDKKTLKLSFVTESVDGTSSAGIIKSLTGLSKVSADSALNLETLNMGSFTIELSPRTDVADRFDALATLELIVHVDSTDPESDADEIKKTLTLRNLGNVKKTGPGSYEGLLRINSRVVRLKLQKAQDRPRSGELILIQENGDEKKILGLIEER